MLPVMLFCVFSPPNSRCGFAGETGPRFIIPSEIRKRGQQQVRRKSLFYLSTLYSVIIRSPLSWSLMVCCIISLSGNQSGSVQHKHRRALCHPKRVYPHSVLQVLYCMLFDSEFKKNNNKLTIWNFLQIFPIIRHLLVNPRDRRVVIIESILCPSHFRETLTKVFFKQFEVQLDWKYLRQHTLQQQSPFLKF